VLRHQLLPALPQLPLLLGSLPLHARLLLPDAALQLARLLLQLLQASFGSCLRLSRSRRLPGRPLLRLGHAPLLRAHQPLQRGSRRLPRRRLLLREQQAVLAGGAGHGIGGLELQLAGLQRRLRRLLVV
jgi:hypothetical protein